MLHGSRTTLSVKFCSDRGFGASSHLYLIILLLYVEAEEILCKCSLCKTRFSCFNNFLQPVCVCLCVNLRDHHWATGCAQGPIQDQMLLLCCCRRVAHIFINHYSNTSPPLLVNNRAYGLPCLPLCPLKKKKEKRRHRARGSSRSHMMKQPEPLISL